jgi:hypothetical protein
MTEQEMRVEIDELRSRLKKATEKNHEATRLLNFYETAIDITLQIQSPRQISMLADLQIEANKIRASHNLR